RISSGRARGRCVSAATRTAGGSTSGAGATDAGPCVEASVTPAKAPPPTARSTASAVSRRRRIWRRRRSSRRERERAFGSTGVRTLVRARDPTSRIARNGALRCHDRALPAGGADRDRSVRRLAPPAVERRYPRRPLLSGLPQQPLSV